MNDWIAISPEPLSPADAIAFVSDDNAGAVDVFLGTTRAERNASGQDLVALDYEAYAEMAVAQMNDIARRVRDQWSVLRCAILHRIGRVPVAQPSVVIAVSTPHRADSFAACRFVIDTLKKEVTIWKKEVWAGGDETWVHPRG
jgi:molybdopterin synthase catalytic subunit